MQREAWQPHWEVHSATPGLAWPALPLPGAANALALLFQLEATQWLDAEALRGRQLRQVEALLRHAYHHTSHYRERWAGLYDPAQPLDAGRFAALPLLARRDLQQRLPQLTSAGADPRLLIEVSTSGSTGSPLRILKPQATALATNVFTLRDHLWNRRDLAGRLAAIRDNVPEGETNGWGGATNGLVATGPAAVLSLSRGIGEQLEWLQRQNPMYLLTFPSSAGALARASIERGLRVPALREVRTIGEPVSPELRALCRQAWGVGVTDSYSAAEVGTIALQCPGFEHYHVQSEGVLVELLDERGAPCPPGRLGRVIITDLTNFAVPLVRYEIGDYAVAGELCPCGRGLPVLSRIAGRVRNLLVTADGERYWPVLDAGRFAGVAPVLQHQFVQKSFDLVEARLVTEGRLTTAQEDTVRRMILERLPPGFRMQIVYCDAIARGAGGKFEDFICEVADPGPAQRQGA